MNWVQPDSERLRAALPGLFGALTRHHYLAARGAEIATSDAGVGAAALWDPPGRWGQSSREQIAMLPAVLRAFRGRVISATNRSLDELRAEGEFRNDFYYRLCSDVIRMPTLRQRIEEDADELPRLTASLLQRHMGSGAADALLDELV